MLLSIIINNIGFMIRLNRILNLSSFTINNKRIKIENRRAWNQGYLESNFQ
jgi:hypothetical protein